MAYNKFKVMALHDGTSYRVLVKGWFGWLSGFVNTNYFSVSYNTLEEAKEAIKGYKNRFTDIGED